MPESYLQSLKVVVLNAISCTLSYNQLTHTFVLDKVKLSEVAGVVATSSTLQQQWT